MPEIVTSPVYENVPSEYPRQLNTIKDAKDHLEVFNNSLDHPKKTRIKCGILISLPAEETVMKNRIADTALKSLTKLFLMCVCMDACMYACMDGCSKGDFN